MFPITFGASKRSSAYSDDSNWPTTKGWIGSSPEVSFRFTRALRRVVTPCLRRRGTSLAKAIEIKPEESFARSYVDRLILEKLTEMESAVKLGELADKLSDKGIGLSTVRSLLASNPSGLPTMSDAGFRRRV